MGDFLFEKNDFKHSSVSLLRVTYCKSWQNTVVPTYHVTANEMNLCMKINLNVEIKFSCRKNLFDDENDSYC